MFDADEQRIIERLRYMLPGRVKVLPGLDINDVKDHAHKAPAVFVVFEGLVPAQSERLTPKRAQVTVQWSIVAMAKSARGAGNGTGAKSEVSELSEQALTALLGYPMGPNDTNPLVLAGAGAPESLAGMAYVPVGFTCTRNYTASTQPAT